MGLEPTSDRCHKPAHNLSATATFCWSGRHCPFLLSPIRESNPHCLDGNEASYHLTNRDLVRHSTSLTNRVFPQSQTRLM